MGLLFTLYGGSTALHPLYAFTLYGIRLGLRRVKYLKPYTALQYFTGMARRPTTAHAGRGPGSTLIHTYFSVHAYGFTRDARKREAGGGGGGGVKLSSRAEAGG